MSAAGDLEMGHVPTSSATPSAAARRPSVPIRPEPGLFDLLVNSVNGGRNRSVTELLARVGGPSEILRHEGGDGGVDEEQGLLEPRQTLDNVTAPPPAAAEGPPQDPPENPLLASTEMEELARMLPFVIVLCIYFFFSHLIGMLVVIYLSGIFDHSNKAIREQYTLKSNRSVVRLLAIASNLATHVVLIYYIFESDKPWEHLLYPIPTSEVKLYNLLFTLTINDFCVRFAVMAGKALFVALGGGCGSHKRRGQFLSVLELSVMCYRDSLPVPMWYGFFMNGGDPYVFAAIVTSVYMILKGVNLTKRVGNLLMQIMYFIRGQLSFGRYVSASEAADLEECAICQDPPQDGVMLVCGHAFCEECIAQWLERNKTCPLCRAAVETSGPRSYFDGSTHPFIMVL